MARYNGRHRSSSVGSASSYSGGPQSSENNNNNTVSETATPSANDKATCQRLLASIMYMKDRSGNSFLHTNYHLSWAKALLDRAKSLDQQQEATNGPKNSSFRTCLLQRRFLLQPDEESGYTPLHRAVMESNLAAILLIVRHISNTDGTERFTQRPMSVLHLADHSNNNGSSNNPKLHTTTTTNLLASRVTTAVDHEGFTPLQLLGKMQTLELEQCRLALNKSLPQVDVRALQRVRPRRQLQHANQNHHDEHDLQVGLFSENGDLLLPQNTARASSSDDDDDEDSDNSSQGERTSLRNQRRDTGNSSYACEVMTFGRGCALGVVSSGKTLPSTSSASNKTKDHHQPFYNATTFFPQRVQEFAQEVVGRNGTAIMAAAATHHTLIVLKNGHLYSFGVEKGGRLGLGDDQPQQCPLPRRVLGPLNRRHVVYVAAAENHSLCVTKDGHVFAWGSDRFGQLGLDTVPMCGGSNDNSSGTNNSRTSPRRVEDLKNHPCVAVAAGDKHSVALTRRGEVYVWGDNSSGQLGVPRRTGIQKVQRVEALWNKNFPKVALAIAASEQSTLVLTAPAQGTQLNSMYEWGNGNHVPLRVHFERNGESNDNHSSTNRYGSSRRRIPNPVAVACGKHHNVAIDSDGMVYTWGLHADSLGRSNKSTKQGQAHGHQRRNSSPQLVTGMLPEKGGGYAVRIAASGQHTAVVTNTGALYTWGNTDAQSVLGHEGIRWQPSPRRVPGVHRAVFVAVAKEHTVLLVGASFPRIPKIVDPPLSLESCAARKIVEHVDLFNVVPIMVMAERTECNFLISYCNEFIRKNLDAVLCVGRKRDLNIYLNGVLSDTTYRAGRRFRDDHHHPLVFDILSAGNHWRVDDGARQWWSQTAEWTHSCVELAKDPRVQRMLELADMREYEEDRQSGLKLRNRRRTSSCNSDGGNPRQRSRSSSGGSFLEMSSEKTAAVTGSEKVGIRHALDADASTNPLAKQKQSSLSREIRNVRKKLKQIASLEDRSVILSTDEKAKVSRRSSLESELRIYETALEEVDRQIRKLAEEAKMKPQPPEVSELNDTEKGSAPQKVTFADEKSLAKQERDSVTSKSPLEKEHFFCTLCSVRCSDKSSFLLHQNGRKHRNRSLQVAEEEAKKTAADLLERKQAEQLKQNSTPKLQKKQIVAKNAWGAIPFKLPPPPHPIPQTASPTLKTGIARQPSEVRPTPRRSEVASAATKFSAPIAYQSPKKSKSPMPSAKMPNRSPENNKPIWDSSPGSNRCVPLSVQSSTGTISSVAFQPDFNAAAASDRASVSLADFLTPKNPKSTSTKSSPMTWSSPRSTLPAPSSNSLRKIVAEEADLRDKQDKSYGKGGGSWYVERRQRADSILEIQQVAEKEAEYEQLVEEQKAIEAQIQQDLRNQQRLDTKKDTSANKKTRGGRNRNQGAATTKKKKAPRKPKSSKGNPSPPPCSATSAAAVPKNATTSKGKQKTGHKSK